MTVDRRIPAGLIRHRRVFIAIIAAVVVLGPVAYFWASSLLPNTYSVMDMGYPDFGGGPQPGGPAMPGMAGMAGGGAAAPGAPAPTIPARSVDSLTVGT